MLSSWHYNITIEQLDKGYLVYNYASNGFAITDHDFMEFFNKNQIIDSQNISDKE